MNFLCLLNMEETDELGKVKYSMGRGNNHKLVTKFLMDRQDLETNTFWNSSHIVWTQTPSKRSNCTIYSKIYDREMSDFKKSYSGILGNFSEETIKKKF